MDKFFGRLIVLIAVLGIGIFYGVSMSKDGIEEIHGPLQEQSVHQEQKQEQGQGQGQGQASVQGGRQQAREAAALAVMQEELDAKQSPLESTSDTFIMKLLGKVGTLLHLLADGIIRLLVRLGEAVLS